MTQALCLNCGEIKFGAICPCPKCEAASTGDMGLDIAFSDHQLDITTLREFGDVVRTIHTTGGEPGLCFWAFIQYVSERHPNILHVDLDPVVQSQIVDLLEDVTLPDVTIRQKPSRSDAKETN